MALDSFTPGTLGFPSVGLAKIAPFQSRLGDQLGNFADPASQPGLFPLSLGSIIFATSECPEKIEFGLTTKVKLTELIGGGIDSAVFGTYPMSVTWTGRIRAQNVDARVASLRQMQRSQQEVLVTHRNESYYCYISESRVTQLTVDAEYSITVQVTRAANGSIASATPISVDTQVSALTTQAKEKASSIALIDAAGAIPLQAAATKVSGAVQNAGPIAQLTGSPLNSLLTTINSATATAKAYAAKLSPVAAQFVQAQQLITAFTLAGRNVFQGQYANSIQVLGGSLAEIAATHYGNADLGPVIGAANGIFGNRLPPGILTTLQLPPFPVTTQATSAIGPTASFGSFGS
jgi:hypothetical protein